MKYQYSYCPYIYHEEEGDPDNGIAAWTSFESLPDTWACPVCEAEKMRFEKIKKLDEIFFYPQTEYFRLNPNQVRTVHKLMTTKADF